MRVCKDGWKRLSNNRQANKRHPVSIDLWLLKVIEQRGNNPGRSASRGPGLAPNAREISYKSRPDPRITEIPSDTHFDDRAVATAEVGSYQPNAWGLYDMHGNVAEWTRSTDKPYPYRDGDRNLLDPHGRKVVRGGSFYDRPKRCRSAFRLRYPAWQRVHNVGFRVVSEVNR